MKELKDYIHLYIGCGVKILCEMPDGNYTVSGVVTKAINEQDLCRVQVFNKQRQQIYWLDIDVIHALILRPLESMSAVEKVELAHILGGVDHMSVDAKIAQVTELMGRFYNMQTNIPAVKWMHACRYFCSIGLDIFDLKEAGLAVYETTTTP